jgi:hypothetical protein
MKETFNLVVSPIREETDHACNCHLPRYHPSTRVIHTHGKILLTKTGNKSCPYGVCPICGEQADDLYAMHLKRYLSRTYNDEVYGDYIDDPEMPVTFGHYECLRTVDIDNLDAVALTEN